MNNTATKATSLFAVQTLNAERSYTQ